MNVEVGLNLKTGKLGTIVGPPPIDVVPFSSMSERQRKFVIFQLVPIEPVTMEYAVNNPTTARCQQFFETYELYLKGKATFNPLHFAELRDEVEKERAWRV